MNDMIRRNFLKNVGSVAGGMCVAELSTGAAILSASTKKTDVRIEDISHSYEEYLYRTPNKFAGTVVDRATLMTVKCTIRTSAGKVAKGFGSMPLGNVWSFPSKKMSYAATLGAMKRLVEVFAGCMRSFGEFGPPIELAHQLEPLFLAKKRGMETELGLTEPIPVLCALVAASAFDA